MTYQEYRAQEQADFDSLPIFWAFGNEQFKRAMEERGLTVDDTDKLYCLGGGGYYLKSDADKIREFFNKPNKLVDLMEHEQGFAESAFYYEMANHEYHINWQGDWDVCECFGKCKYRDDKTAVDYLHECGYSDNVIAAFANARRKFYKDAEQNDWY